MSGEDIARKALIAKALAARQIHSSSSSSPSSSSSEEEEVRRPVFVPRDQRSTMAKAQAAAESEAAAMQQAEEDMLRHRQKVAALAEAQLEIVELTSEDTKAPDIGIEDSPECFALWKIREMKRIMKKSGQIQNSDLLPNKGVFFQ